MAKNARVKLNTRGLNEVMKSQGVEDDLKRRGGRIAATAGAGYKVVVKPHKWVARVFVQPETVRAIRNNAKNNTLVRSLDAGR